MKSNKSQRMSLPPRSRSSKGADSKSMQSPKLGGSASSDTASPGPRANIAPSDAPSRYDGTIVSANAPPKPSGDSDTDVEELRRRMAEAMLQKQGQSPSKAAVPGTRAESSPSSGSIAQRRCLAGEPPSSTESVAGAALSTDSAKTVKGNADTTPGAIRTPSYPFPRMTFRMNRESSHRSAPSHKPFTLLSPTNEPTRDAQASPRSGDGHQSSSELSTPAPQQAGEDPIFPTPDLYDMILMLTAEPGLDAWWANVTQILAEAYGAERASLAVPGDNTDLENVPWGQKATFNIYGTDGFGSSTRESAFMSEPDLGMGNRKYEESPTTASSAAGLQRPSLESRHSIAGIHPDPNLQGSRQRPQGPVRAISNISGRDMGSRSRSVSPRIQRQSSRRGTSFVAEKQTLETKHIQASSESATSVMRSVVHRTLQALELEPDPLMVRTGISSLFGKRKPLVLTRAYGDEVMSETSGQSGFDKDKGKGVASTAVPPRSESIHLQRYAGSYDEYEQPEPSPWSQSPAPSPAARPDPSESPFFAQPASIDEAAFEQNPPNYDYAATANQSLAAIGADSSKTLIHVPLIQPVPSRGILSSSLRFPIAIVSLLTPITPYPRNLRHSLTHLLPHLASSYSLAQQYSTLQDRARAPFTGRPSAGFGLGGTFSDENSELELVAELSGQVTQGTGRDSRSSMHSSVHSVSERQPAGGASLSAPSTPFYGEIGVSPGLPATPGKSGADVVDSYFSTKRQKGAPLQQITTPGGRSLFEESPEAIRSSKYRSWQGSRSSKKASTTPRRQGEPPTPSASRTGFGLSEIEESQSSERPGQPPQRHWSQQSAQSALMIKESTERPLPELISSLMLNSVPLQLFLAKPKSGELVWTNSKFDAFRTQGEGRVRDPWQNVHADDLSPLSRGWKETLKTGNQFTQHVRVKRFSGDTDYRWFIFRANPLLSQNGQLLYWIGSFLDVHETHMTEMRAAEEKETFARDAKYRALANSIPQILFEAIEQEGIVSANEQWHTFSGQPLEEALNLGFAKHVHRDDLQKCGLISPDESRKIVMLNTSAASTTSSSDSSSKTVQAATIPSRRSAGPASLETLIQDGVIKVERDENGRVSYTTELRLRSKGGEFRWFLVRLVKVESDLLNKGKASWYGTCTDINDRKALERELNRVNKRMFQEMESKTKFFANMSHEIRTPLNGILGSIPWLVESALDHDQRRTLDTIQNSSNNLRELVDNILDVTKVEAGKMSLVYKFFHVRTLLEEIIDTIASRAIDKGLELNYTVDQNVPSYVKGDPFRLRQVLINLMGNAVKFTETGEVYTRCSIKEQPQSDVKQPNVLLLAFDVIDTGRGFDEAGFQRLFKQFGQIDGSSSHDAGSGLGLFLSKQLVEMHGGYLSAVSELDQGATFSFFIKVEIGSEIEQVSSPSSGGLKKRSSTSESTSPRSRSESNTLKMSMTRSIIQSPGASKIVASPDRQSPAILSSGSSDPSLRSVSGQETTRSSISSTLATPESSSSSQASLSMSERQLLAEQAMMSTPGLRRASSDTTGTLIMTAEQKHPTMYSVVIVCPAQHARAAIKQHIEQVVPHQVAINVTILGDIGAFRELVNGPGSPTFTHIVLDLPATADVMLFLRQMTNFTATLIPHLIIITDHYQKRDITEDFTALIKSGRKAFIVNKPVKPSVFAPFFDPAQLRNLSKDRTRDMAQSVTENFKNVAERVKRTIGSRGHRVLLVEDSDVNRLVIMRYLKKVDVLSDTAVNGLECTEKVMSKPQRYYSLIIVSQTLRRESSCLHMCTVRHSDARQERV